MLSTTLSAVLALLGAASSVTSNNTSTHLVEPGPVALDPAAYAQFAGTTEPTAEGAEILRRILAEALDQALGEKEEADHFAVHERRSLRLGGLVTTLWAGNRTVEHSRAFHLPEVGLFFTLDAALPVVAIEKKAETEKSKEAPADDEWERTRREVRGTLTSVDGAFHEFRFAPTAPSEIDPKAIERTIDLVLRTLSRHVGRIEGLAPGETVTVALRLSGRSRTLLQDFAPDQLGEFQLFDGVPGHDLRGDRIGKDDGKNDDEDFGGEEAPEPGSKAKTFSAYVLATGHEVREQSLVIRIALADLTARAETPERLRQRAWINLY